MSIEAGVLYVVATPIGNLADISPRALETLRQVAAIAAEDTRHSARLLQHYGIATATVSLHRHNEARTSPRLVERLQSGESLALISDAGTPLLSDPGLHLVRKARSLGLRVVPIPGPSAITSALSVSGLSADRFVFEGFLPSKSAARKRRLQELGSETRTIVFFEAPHRILETLRAMGSVLGSDRPAVVAREISKMFEEVHDASLGDLCIWLEAQPERTKGEFVVMVQGASAAPSKQASAEDERVLAILLEYLPVSKAAAAAARLTGKNKSVLYEKALQMER